MKPSNAMIEVMDALKETPMTIQDITKTFYISRQTFHRWLNMGCFVQVSSTRPYMYQSTGYIPVPPKNGTIASPVYNEELMQKALKEACELEPVDFASIFKNPTVTKMANLEVNLSKMIELSRWIRTLLKEESLN